MDICKLKMRKMKKWRRTLGTMLVSVDKSNKHQLTYNLNSRVIFRLWNRDGLHFRKQLKEFFLLSSTNGPAEKFPIKQVSFICSFFHPLVCKSISDAFLSGTIQWNLLIFCMGAFCHKYILKVTKMDFRKLFFLSW